MEKITNQNELRDIYTFNQITEAKSDSGNDYTMLNDNNFWQVREQCRINDGTYTQIRIDGDDKMRFLHVSVDDPAKVSYTKDADKGRQDIQTRTTLAAYCEKFGLEMPPVAPVREDIARGIMAAAQAMSDTTDQDALVALRAQPNTSVSAQTQTQHVPGAGSIHNKLNLAQALVDDVLADLG